MINYARLIMNTYRTFRIIGRTFSMCYALGACYTPVWLIHVFMGLYQLVYLSDQCRHYTGVATIIAAVILQFWARCRLYYEKYGTVYIYIWRNKVEYMVYSFSDFVAC